MTNLELAQQQGNQAAPNLLAAATAGELGGGGSLYILPEQANLVVGQADYTSSSDQVDEEAAQTIYDNFKIVNPKLEVFSLKETFGEESYVYFYALSQRMLDMIKSSLASASAIGIITEREATETLSVLNTMSPDELIYTEQDILGSAVEFPLYYSFDGELPLIAKGLCQILCLQGAESGPFAGLIYTQITLQDGNMAFALSAQTHRADSRLARPVKLEKPVYSVTSH